MLKQYQEFEGVVPKSREYAALVEIGELYDKFQANSEVAVTALLNTFNRKKNAWQSVNKKFFETGNLDVSRLHDYKTSEDIFENGVSVRKGKNHGVTILVDWSGSMQAILVEVSMQIDIMVRFCQRARVPFQVLHFTDRSYENVVPELMEHAAEIRRNDGILPIVPTRVLKTLVSSDMPIQDQQKAMFRFFMFSGEQSSGFYWSEYGVTGDTYPLLSQLRREAPLSHLIGSTPIADSLMTLRYITKDFMQRNRVEIMNTILMTDGEENQGFPGYGGHKTSYMDNATGRTIEANPLLTGSMHPTNVNIAVKAYKAMTQSTVTGIYMTKSQSVGKTSVAKFFSRSISFNAANKIDSGKGFFDAKNIFDFDRFLAVTTANIIGYLKSSEIETSVKENKKPTAANVASAYVAAAEVKKSALWLSQQIAEQICSEFSEAGGKSSMDPNELSALMEECKKAQAEEDAEEALHDEDYGYQPRRW